MDRDYDNILCKKCFISKKKYGIVHACSLLYYKKVKKSNSLHQSGIKPSKLYRLHQNYKYFYNTQPLPSKKAKSNNLSYKFESCMRSALSGHSDCVLAVIISPDDKYIISAGEDPKILVWDLDSLSLIYHIQVNSPWTQALNLSHDSKYLIAGGGDHIIRVFNFHSGTLYAELRGHSDYVGSVAITHDQHHFISSSNHDDYIIRFWDLRSRTQAATLTGHTSRISEIRISPDDKYVISAGARDRIIRFWNLQTFRQETVIKGEHTNWLSSIHVSPDFRYIFSAAFDNKVIVYDGHTKETVKVIQGEVTGNGGIITMSISTDMKYIITAGHDSIIRIWNLETGRLEQSLYGHDDSIRDCAITNDNRYIITTDSSEISLRVWDFYTD